MRAVGVYKRAGCKWDRDVGGSKAGANRRLPVGSGFNLTQRRQARALADFRRAPAAAHAGRDGCAPAPGGWRGQGLRHNLPGTPSHAAV